MPDTNMVDFYVMGEHHVVPDSLTVLQAMEYSGYRLVRGVGDRHAAARVLTGSAS